MNVDDEIRKARKRIEELEQRKRGRPQGTSASVKDFLRYLLGKDEKLRCTTKIMSAFNMTYPTFVERAYLALGRGWVTRERKNNMVVWTITENGKKELKECGYPGPKNTAYLTPIDCPRKE